MITSFTTVYAGHVDLPDRGQDTTPANERRYSNEHLASVFEKTEAIAKKMDALGYDTLWLAEHHFQHEGLRVHPQRPDAGGASRALTRQHQDRLRLQHRADVAPAASGRGFRDRRHPDRRPRRLRGRAAAITPARSRRSARRCSTRTPTASCSRSRSRSSSRPSTGVLLAQGQVLHAAARGSVPRLHAEGAHPRAAPDPPAGRVLAADRQRQPARARLHGEARHQGRRSAAARRRCRRGRSTATERRAPATVGKHRARRKPASGCTFTSRDSASKAIREITPIYEEHVKMFAPLGFVPGLTPEQIEASRDAAAGPPPGCPPSSIT